MNFTSESSVGSTVDNEALPLRIHIHCLVSTM